MCKELLNVRYGSLFIESDQELIFLSDIYGGDKQNMLSWDNLTACKNHCTGEIQNIFWKLQSKISHAPKHALCITEG